MPGAECGLLWHILHTCHIVIHVSHHTARVHEFQDTPGLTPGVWATCPRWLTSPGRLGGGLARAAAGPRRSWAGASEAASGPPRRRGAGRRGRRGGRGRAGRCGHALCPTSGCGRSHLGRTRDTTRGSAGVTSTHELGAGRGGGGGGGPLAGQRHVPPQGQRHRQPVREPGETSVHVSTRVCTCESYLPGGRGLPGGMAGMGPGMCL